MAWKEIYEDLHITHIWGTFCIEDSFNYWGQLGVHNKILSIFVCWVVWNMRIKFLFEDYIPIALVFGMRGLGLYKEYQPMVSNIKQKQNYAPSFNFSSAIFLRSFFNWIWWLWNDSKTK